MSSGSFLRRDWMQDKKVFKLSKYNLLGQTDIKPNFFLIVSSIQNANRLIESKRQKKVCIEHEMKMNILREFQRNVTLIINVTLIMEKEQLKLKCQLEMSDYFPQT